MRALVIGGSGGLGSAVVEQLRGRSDMEHITATYCRSKRESHPAQPQVDWRSLDLLDADAIARLIEELDPPDWVINCSGLLHDPLHQPEKSLAAFDAELFRRSMALHCEANLHLARALTVPFKTRPAPRLLVLSARVGSISDNRLGGWYSYRCSKAALNMAVKTIAIEWQRRLPKAAIVAYHPGTTDTALSKPFQRHVPKGKLFTPAYSAERLLGCLELLKQEDSGDFLAWDGSRLPF